ncbi:MAG: hypothetical protein Q8N46_03095 [Anaerolineales bacterium]|nr:hypothetical protein [Anaerolineales bacterium]
MLCSSVHNQTGETYPSIGLDGMVLELPYIFGAMPIPGWKPL